MKNNATNHDKTEAVDLFRIISPLVVVRESLSISQSLGHREHDLDSVAREEDAVQHVVHRLQFSQSADPFEKPLVAWQPKWGVTVMQ